MRKQKNSELNFLLINLEGTALLTALSYLIYTKIPYFKGFIGVYGISLLVYFFFIYLFVNLIYFLYCYTKKIPLGDSKIALLYSYLLNFFKPEKIKVDKKKLKTAILSIAVKFFFFPIMFSFFIGRWPTVSLGVSNLISGKFDLFADFNYTFDFIITLLFFFDTLIFTFGYAFEAKELKSEIKSVEPTFFGWFIALASYPPLNTQTSQFLSNLPVFLFGNSANTFMITKTLVTFGSSGSSVVILRSLKILTLFAYLLYVWATFALGTKSSNLTNRGIVSKGPYKFIRHPAYISKNIAWWIEGFMRGLSLAGLVSLLGWNIIYYFRAKTEEDHLLTDPDYKKYIKKVKWMFIPGVI
ncbi:hypothetical protein JW796_04155 [Candidatus Dojkabacteria bacterium]|nr:hypothetical protein [Candidatus Dojkabacteria bacterium]